VVSLAKVVGSSYLEVRLNCLEDTQPMPYSQQEGTAAYSPGSLTSVVVCQWMDGEEQAIRAPEADIYSLFFCTGRQIKGRELTHHSDRFI
jgi:hypothetical protein